VSATSELLDALKERVGGSWAALADLLSVSPQHVSRVRRGLIGLSADVVAHAAVHAGKDPVQELRKCGHGRLVDSLASALGAWETLTAEEREFVLLVRRSAPAVRESIRMLLKAATDQTATKGRVRKEKSKRSRKPRTR
jgi:hypothetical protein